MQRRITALTALMLAMAACGSSQGAVRTTSTGSASSSSPSHSQGLIVVAEEPAAGYLTGPTPVRLMRSDGKEVDKLTVKQGSRVARAAGKRILVHGHPASNRKLLLQRYGGGRPEHRVLSWRRRPEQPGDQPRQEGRHDENDSARHAALRPGRRGVFLARWRPALGWGRGQRRLRRSARAVRNGRDHDERRLHQAACH